MTWEVHNSSGVNLLELPLSRFPTLVLYNSGKQGIIPLTSLSNLLFSISPKPETLAFLHPPANLRALLCQDLVIWESSLETIQSGILGCQFMSKNKHAIHRNESVYPVD